MVFRKNLGRSGVLKIFTLFNHSPLGEVRKLCGRLVIEALRDSFSNQDFLCELLDIEPLDGFVTLNAQLPSLIKQKLTQNTGFLQTIHSLQDINEP